MSLIPSQAKRIWKSAQLYIGFHRDQSGQRRTSVKVWPPKNANASIHSNPEEQEAFLVVKSEDRQNARDVQIKLRQDKFVLRRDAGEAWEGIIVEDHMVSIQVNGTWIRIMGDGSISHAKGSDTTYVEADGSVLKKTEYVEAMMSGDGKKLTRRTHDNISAIDETGIVSKARG